MWDLDDWDLIAWLGSEWEELRKHRDIFGDELDLLFDLE